MARTHSTRLSMTAVAAAALAMAAGCGGRGGAPNPQPAAGTGGAANTGSAAASLLLAGTTYPLRGVTCVSMGEMVMIAAKTQDGEQVAVDTEKEKVADLSFKAGGVDYFWEPTSTGGAPDPVLVKNGNSYTVTGKIKQLHDATKLSDFTFTAACPRSGQAS